MSDQPQASGYTPDGYCPKCDYPTGVGTCPECGVAIGAHALRRRPRSWLHRHWRGVAGAVLVPAVGLWIVSGRVNLIPLLPTSYLLDWQSDHAPRAVIDELARRVAAGRMSAGQEERFFKQWLAAEWSTERHRHVQSWRPPATRKPSIRGIAVSLREVRVNGAQLPNARIHINTPRAGSATCDDGRPPVALHASFRRRPNWGGISLFLRLNFITPVVLACVDDFAGAIEIDSTVEVSDAGTGRVVASWPTTSSVSFVAPWPLRLETECGSNVGGEDMVYPYGIIPKRPEIIPAWKRAALTPAYERMWRKRGAWIPADRIGLPGEGPP